MRLLRVLAFLAVAAACVTACSPFTEAPGSDGGAGDVGAADACDSTCGGATTCRTWDFAAGCDGWTFSGDTANPDTAGTCTSSVMHIAAKNTLDLTATTEVTSPNPTQNVHASVKASLAEWQGQKSLERQVMVLADGTEIAQIRANSSGGPVVYALCPGTGVSGPCANKTIAVARGTEHRLTLDVDGAGKVTFSVDCAVVATYDSMHFPGSGTPFKLTLGATDGEPIDGTFDDVVLGFNQP